MRKVSALYLSLILHLVFTGQGAQAQQLDLVVQTGHSETVSAVAFSPNGKLIASAGYEHTIKLWDVETGLQIKEFRPQEQIYFQPSNFSKHSSAGTRIINGKNEFVEYAFVNELFLPQTPLSKYLSENLSSRTQELIREYHDRPTLELLKALANDLNRILKSTTLYSEERFKGVDLSPEVQALLDKSPTGESLSKLNRLLLEEAYPKYLGQSQGGYEELAFSHDNSLLAARTYHEEVQVWAVETGAEISIYQFAPKQISFSPDDKILAVIAWPRSINLYDAASGMLTKILSTPDSNYEPKAITYSPDGKTLLSIEQYSQHYPRDEGEKDDEGFYLRHWDVDRGMEESRSSRQVKADTNRQDTQVQTQCASPDGRALVYEVARKIKDEAGNDIVRYQANLLRLDTGIDTKIEEGFRPYDELSFWTSNKKISCEFSHDGRSLALGKGETLKLYSAQTGEHMKDYPLDFMVDVLSFDGSGSELALASGNEIALFDLKAGKVSNTLVNHVASVHGYFTQDGGRLILSRGGGEDEVFELAADKERSGAGEYGARIEALYTSKRWDVSAGRCITTEEHSASEPDKYIPQFVSKKFLSPDGKLLALPEMSRVQISDVKTGKVIRYLSGHLREVKDVAFSPDGRILASGSWDHTIKLWDVASWKEIRSLAAYQYTLGMMSSISFSPDGRLIAATGQNDFVRVWDIASGSQRAAFRHGDVLAVAFAPQSDRLVTAGRKGVMKVWNLSTGAELFALKGHTDDVLTLGFDIDGRILASGSEDKTIKLWDFRTGSEVRTLKGHEHPVIYVGFTNERELISESGEESVEVWDTTNKQKIQTLRGFDGEVRGILSPDSRTLALEDASEKISFWDAATARHLFSIKWDKKDEHREIDEGTDVYDDRTLLAFGKDLFAVAFLSKSKVGSLGDWGKQRTQTYTLKLWSLGERGVRGVYSKEVKIFDAENLLFSPDGKWLIISGSTILLWNTEDHETLIDIGQSGYTESFDISPHDDVLALGGNGGEIRLLDVATRKERDVLRGHTSRITGLAFHPEKNILMSESSDGTFKFWDVKAGRELATLIPLDNDDWVVVDPDGRFDASPNAMKLMHYVYGLEVITLEQIKDAYYEPGLLAKLVGSSKEPLRSIRPLRDVKLYPEVVRQEFRLNGSVLSVMLKNRGGGIGPVRIAVNGKTITEDARDDKLKANPLIETACIKYDLKGSTFVAGMENQITVTTSNYDPQTRKGYINSRGATIVFTPRGETNLDPPRLYAIVGGISKYAGDSLALRFAAKDAEDFAKALRVGAEKLFGAERVNISVLSTTGNEGTVWPSKKNFMDAFAEVAKKARPEDVLVIYLAGHGVSSGLNADTYYYLTQESQSSSIEPLSNPDVRETTAISSSELIDWLTKTEWVKGEKGIKPLKQVMILDTCAAGTIAGQFSLMTRRELSGDQIRAIERLKDRTGFHILMGSAADAVSYEATQYGQGLLTYALLQAMRGAKLRDGEFADVSELFQYAADEVPRLARDIGGIQRPVVAAPLGTSFDIGRFTKDEQMRVPLARVKPLILTPRLIDPEQGYDDLGLEDSMRKSLRESSYAAARGRIGGALSVNYVFVDADEMPGAVRPSGTYVIRGSAVTVTLNLIRDGRKAASFQVTGDKTDVDALAYKLTAGVAEALNGLP